jgi:2-C-methyl-D-erythritol 4-phosphate cytidylyltransferase
MTNQERRLDEDMVSTKPASAARVAVVVPAAGVGSRIGTGENKTLLKVAGVPVIERCVRVFCEHPQIERIVIVARPGEISRYEAIFTGQGWYGKIESVIEGGMIRQDSVWRGIAALDADPPDIVLVHDGARPFCSPELLDRVLTALQSHSAVVPVLPLTDTIRRVSKTGAPSGVVEREGLYRSQTPQGFHWRILSEAFVGAREAGLEATDDAQLVEAAGHEIHFVAGEKHNIKITEPDDLHFAEWASQNLAKKKK